VLTPDPESCEFTVTAIFPDVTEQTIRERTGWKVAIAATPQTTLPPSAAELAALRAIMPANFK